MNKLENLVDMVKLSELLGKKESECTEAEECREGKTLVWILAIIGAITAVAGIAYAVYRFMNRNSYLDDFEDDFEDEFEDEEAEDDEEDFFVDEGEN